MKYTQAQLLSTTGITLDRLRHWRKEIPSLNAKAGRKGTLSFEDLALVAVLSRAVDVIGVALGVFAPHYDDLLAALHGYPDISSADIVLWLNGQAAVIGDQSRPPPGEVLAMIRFAPILRRLAHEVQQTGSEQLRLKLDGGAAPRRP